MTQNTGYTEEERKEAEGKRQLRIVETVLFVLGLEIELEKRGLPSNDYKALFEEEDNPDSNEE